MSMLRVLLVAGGMLALSSARLPAQAMNVTCKDGTKSAGGQGACSGHGGLAAPTVTCRDGTKSTAGQGACSSHGGISVRTEAKVAKTVAKADAKVAKTAAKADAKAAKMLEKTEDRDPKGATARCKDGTYSHAKSPQGMCSGHGGVAKLLRGK